MSETRRFPWGLTLAVIPAMALLLGLGVWQVRRLHWKEGLIAEAQAAAAMPVVPVADRDAFTDFRKVELTCPGLATAPYVELNAIIEGQAGVRLISACRVDALGGYLLIDRGFVADTISARPPVEASSAPVRIQGQFREVPGPRKASTYPPPPGLFLHRDEGWMASALGVHPVLGTIFATTSSNPGWAALRPSAPPAAFSNNHLGYAATWFGLAIALAGVYIAMLRKRITA